MYTYEQNKEMVVLQAWEIITNNGLNMDNEEREHYIKACQDAAQNAYYDGLNNEEWLTGTLKILGYEDI